MRHNNNNKKHCKLISLIFQNTTISFDEFLLNGGRDDVLYLQYNTPDIFIPGAGFRTSTQHAMNNLVGIGMTYEIIIKSNTVFRVV